MTTILIPRNSDSKSAQILLSGYVASVWIDSTPERSRQAMFVIVEVQMPFSIEQGLLISPVQVSPLQ